MSELRHPAADPQCAACRGTGLVILADGAFARATACACRKPVCPACKGDGWVQVTPGTRGPVRPCTCKEVASRAARFDLVRFPARYVGATFESFLGTADGAKGFAENVLRRWPTGDRRGLLLYGDVGRGKTHLALALVRELVLRYGVTARFVEFTHLLTDLKMSFEGRSDSTSIVEPLYHVDVLIIDELGKGRCTEFERTVLDDLVSRRYNAGLTIVATTNFHPTAPPTGRPVANLAAYTAADDGPRYELPSLRDRIDDRVLSRLQEMCDFMKVGGDDHRALRGRRRPVARGT